MKPHSPSRSPSPAIQNWIRPNPDAGACSPAPALGIAPRALSLDGAPRRAGGDHDPAAWIDRSPAPPEDHHAAPPDFPTGLPPRRASSPSTTPTTAAQTLRLR